MLQSMDLQFANARTVATFPGAPIKNFGNFAEANTPSKGCELSNRFDSIEAETKSTKTQDAGTQSGQTLAAKAVKIENTAHTSQKVSGVVSQTVSQTAIKNMSVGPRDAAIRSAKPAIASRENLAPSVSSSSHWKFFGESVNQELKVDDVVEKLDSGRLWVVNSRRRNGLIVLREFYAEFAGPGAAVGGDLDSNDIVSVIPIGNLSLLNPDSHEAHQNAIKIRLQWIRLTQNFTDQPQPDDRARMILEQFKTYFDQATVDLVPDEAFALLVGVLPRTIRRVRSGFVW